MSNPFSGAIQPVSSTRYAAPDISRLLYEGIGNLPQDYYQGQKSAQELALSQSLPQGLAPYWSKDPRTGQMVFDAYRYANDQARIGGPAQAAPYVNALMGAQYGAQQSQALAGIAGLPSPGGGLPPGWGPPGTSQPPAYSPTSASPSSNINPARTPGPQSAAPTGQPPEPTGGMDYLAGMATEHYGQDTPAEGAINKVASALRVTPDQTLSPQQIKRARQFFASLSPDGRVQIRPAGSRPDTDPASGPQATFGPSEESAGVPRTYSPGVSGTPGPAPEAPVGGSGPGAVTPQGIIPNRVQATTITPAGANVRTAGGPLGQPAAPPAQAPAPVAGAGGRLIDVPLPGVPREVESLRQKAAAAAIEAARAGLNPNQQMGKGMETGASALAKQYADAYESKLKALYEANKLTPEAVNIYRGMGPAVAAQEGAVEQSKKAGEQYAKRYEDIHQMASKAATETSKIDLALHILSNPKMYTGLGADQVKRFRQAIVTLGGNPHAASLQEEFDKIVSDLTLGTIQTLPPPVRVREMAIVQQSLANKGITIPANQLNLEVARRAYSRAGDLYEIARKYGAAKMGPQYEEEEAKYWATHPLFSKEELADPRRISPPITATPQDRIRLGIPEGFPSRTPDGRIITHGPRPQ